MGIFTYISHKQYSYSLRSQNYITLSVPSVHTVLGKKAISYSAPSTWNALQQELKLTSLIPITDFKLILKKLEKSSVGVCTCFIRLLYMDFNDYFLLRCCILVLPMCLVSCLSVTLCGSVTTDRSLLKMRPCASMRFYTCMNKG